MQNASSEPGNRTVNSAQPASVWPVMLETEGWRDYALIDSGHGRKLERYGPYRIVRPEEQALWAPRRSEAEWERADAVFTGARDEDSDGRWRYPRPLGETWPMSWPLPIHVSTGDVRFLGRFTAFRHVGFFPEQEMHWAWFASICRQAKKPPKVLNLFGYTGIASFVAAMAGAQVTHVDASKKAIGWARENQEMSGIADLPVRWIVEDAVKFVQREIRRGSRYDGIILDPPKFGRGPNGEVWDLFERLPEMMRLCRQLLADDALFLCLSAYSIRASFMAIHELTAEALAGLPGKLESGELLLREEGGGRYLSTSLFSRWSRHG
ncbi:SAM-dependent methyltransferase [Kaistia algarum]|uniref:class I SAM-dependent methyltransferase n=1 Tax=Kaistia algarum TaxID=2083279 RepID=UPI000CE7A8CD|nr:class I SAM-dependent methyltransferase [Kaistia algarum]MCX5516673.1 class I SAM-dependent methyltransferase [Kaistia algarum]PPE78656.1 SAM-dependent methyltransferase [Kaistia algarum]